MRSRWDRIQKWCGPLATGGVTLGIFQGFGAINWAYFFTTFLVGLLGIITLLRSGTPSTTPTV
jgi:hypothetical protein